MDDVVLKTENLTKRYSKTVLDNVNLTIQRGDIYGFVGRNGAGKTTLMRIVAGLSAKTSGGFELLGIKDDDSAIATARRKMSVMVEEASLYPRFTARENVKARCVLLGAKDTDIDGLISLVGLDPTDKKKAKDFSLGMRQRLAIAVAMVGNPEFLMFDEPTNGLDPEGIVHVRNVLVDLNRRQGVTIMVSSHILGELSKLATRFGFIEQGRLLKEITARDLELECSEGMRFRVSDEPKAFTLFQQWGLEILGTMPDFIDVKGNIDGIAIAEQLKNEGVAVWGFERIHADLEDYFMKLIGGYHG
jgi:ABC-2 type transport system ATP-binding protein